MSEQTQRWSEVGSRLEALALKLKLHYEQTGRGEEIPDAMNRLRTSVNEAFEATGNAVRDDAVKADVKEAGRLFVDAVSATFAKVSDTLKDAAENMKDKAGSGASTDQPSGSAETDTVTEAKPEPTAGPESIAKPEPIAEPESTAEAEPPK